MEEVAEQTQEMLSQPKKIKILILRGKPGSGKSYICEKFYAPLGWVHVSADHFFTNARGKYNFNPSQIQVAHDDCYSRTLTAISEGKNVIVDNTNRKLWEFERYITLKESIRLGREVDVAVFKVASFYGTKKDIPRHVIDRYEIEYETYPGEGQVKVLNVKVVFKN